MASVAVVCADSPFARSAKRSHAAAFRSRPCQMRQILIGVIRLYQRLLSPYLPPSCRYMPTCSEYAAEAIRRYGAWRGGGMALRRLSRCHPWGGSGYDPVPMPTKESEVLAAPAANRPDAVESQG